MSRPRHASGFWNPRSSKTARLAMAVVTLIVVTIACAGRGGPAYAANLTTSVTVTPTQAPINFLTNFTVVTDLNPDILDPTFEVEFPQPNLNDVVGNLIPENHAFYYGGTFPATNPVCGTNYVTIIDTAENNAQIGQATINAICPSIQLTPASIASSSEPADVVVSGIDFPGLNFIQISLDGNPVLTTTSNDAGAFTAQVRIHGLDCSPHQITAQATGSTITAAMASSPANTAGAPLTVTGCVSASPSPSASNSTPPPPPPGKPTLVADPNVVEEGQVTHVTGTGYTRLQKVQLTWTPTSGSGAVPGQILTADNSGNLDDYLVVALNFQYVPCNLVATQGTLTASAPILIEGGSLEPASNDELIYRG